MRIVDEFRYLKEKCNLQVNLEPYESKFISFNDDSIINVKNEVYSQRLFFDEKCDTIVKSIHQDEIILNDYDVVCFDCVHISVTKISFEDSVSIIVYEDSKIYKKITC